MVEIECQYIGVFYLESCHRRVTSRVIKLWHVPVCLIVYFYYSCGNLIFCLFRKRNQRKSVAPKLLVWIVMIWCLWAVSESINSHVVVAVPHQHHLVQTVMKGGVITSLLISRIHINWGLLQWLECFIAEKGEGIVYPLCVSGKWSFNWDLMTWDS